MAEHDETPVTVNLDRRRPYRANHSDRTAIWVGPGKAEVPAWVAKEWGHEAGQAPVEPQGVAFLHDAGYDEMNVGAALGYIAGLTETEQAIALAYERRNKNRGTLLTEFD